MTKTNYYTQAKVDQTKIAAAMWNVSRYSDIVNRVSKGETYESIGKDYNITKQRVGALMNYLSNLTNSKGRRKDLCQS